jgi:glutathione S-transferase
MKSPPSVAQRLSFARYRVPSPDAGMMASAPSMQLFWETLLGLAKAREFNLQRYYFQGIGRYEADAVYARRRADLGLLADLVPANAYVHGANPTSIDAGIYGFIANIHFYDIDTPLKRLVASRQNLVRHCSAIHERVMRG